MYEFGLLLFGGLITAKSVDFIRHLVHDMNKAMVLFVASLVGVGYAFLFDVSVFAGWSMAVRTDWLGTLGTGLFMSGFAGFWHEALGMMREWSHRYHSAATETEARLRAA